MMLIWYICTPIAIAALGFWRGPEQMLWFAAGMTAGAIVMFCGAIIEDRTSQ